MAVSVKTFKEAMRYARLAGEDAANRRMRKAGRRKWSAADHRYAVGVMTGMLEKLGYGLAA